MANKLCLEGKLKELRKFGSFTISFCESGSVSLSICIKLDNSGEGYLDFSSTHIEGVVDKALLTIQNFGGVLSGRL